MIVSRLREESVKVFASEGTSEKRSHWKHWKHHNPHWQQFRTRDTRRHWTTLDNITTLYQTLPEVQQTQAIDCLSGLTRRWTCLNSKSKPLQNFCPLPFPRHLFSPPRVHPINRPLLFKRPGSAHSSVKELFTPGQEAAGARPSRAP